MDHKSLQYGKERIIQDVLITSCESKQAKDKIIRHSKGEKITLKDVLEILQLENYTSKTLQNIYSTMKNVHYAHYDKKKSGSKGGKPKAASESSSVQNSNSTSTSGKVCFRCRKPWSKEHEKGCPAKQAKCNVCGLMGHYGKCCKRAGNFPSKNKSSTGDKKKIHVAGNEYYDEDGNLKERVSAHMLSTRFGKKEFLIEFGIGKDLDSMDKKLILKLDTSSDVNAINWKTFKELFPDVELQQSNVVLENFDSMCVQPAGKFKCFLHWKSRRYRIDMDVMS